MILPGGFRVTDDVEVVIIERRRKDTDPQDSDAVMAVGPGDRAPPQSPLQAPPAQTASAKEEDTDTTPLLSGSRA